MLRKLKKDDLVRCAEIIVYNNRKNYYPIFRDIRYSFGEYNVISVMDMFENDPVFMASTYVWEEDEIVKGFITVHDNEILKLYVDLFFQRNHIGQSMTDAFPDASHLWCLEKNTDALKFYAKNGFFPDGTKKYEEGTEEYLVHLVKENHNGNQ